MLSILIPLYNYDSTPLIAGLSAQAAFLKAEGNGFDYEIILMDDASTDMQASAANRQVAEEAQCRYIELPRNVGRARIRNKLAAEAKYDYLLFIDCDALVATPDFVERFWAARDLGDVVCGSLVTPESSPQGCELRYRYERKADSKRSLAARTASPYSHFTTFNVLFHRRVFQSVEFDERCVGYGYEDTLMGLMLQQLGFSVAHIDNPLIHLGIDNNASYLEKTENALHSLRVLGEPLQSNVMASRVDKFLKRWHIDFVLRSFFACVRRPLRRHLLGRSPSVLLFQFYKVGYYSCLASD